MSKRRLFTFHAMQQKIIFIIEIIEVASKKNFRLTVLRRVSRISLVSCPTVTEENLNSDKRELYEHGKTYWR